VNAIAAPAGHSHLRQDGDEGGVGVGWTDFGPDRLQWLDSGHAGVPREVIFTLR
jgi:hypothetical protein